MDEAPASKKMNRAQRRRWQANFRKARLESLPRPASDERKHPMPCDIPGCQEVWMFSTMATVDGTRKVVARRCLAHRVA